MPLQESWSKNSSLNSPFADRQKIFNTSRSVLMNLYGSITDIKDDKLMVKINFEKTELNDTYNGWFLLDITYDKFISRYGSIESFKNLLKTKPILVKLVHQTSNIKNGKAVIIENYDRLYDNEHQANSFSIGSIINGFGESKNNIFNVIKPSYNKDSNTSISLSENSIKLATKEDKFLELSEKGFTISGPVTFQGSPSQISFAGIVALPDFYRGMIPSTVSTPNPLFTPKIPTELLATMKSLADIAALMIS